MEQSIQSFVEKLKPFLLCYVCQGVLVDPVKYQKCQHSFCKICIGNISTQELCPQCGLNSGGSFVSDKILNNLLQFCCNTSGKLNLKNNLALEINQSEKKSLDVKKLTVKKEQPRKIQKNKNQLKRKKLDVSIFTTKKAKNNDEVHSKSDSLDHEIEKQIFTKSSNKNDLKKNGKNIEKKNFKGETPLHSSCVKGNVEKLKELLSLGAKTNTKDYAGWTPLQEAADKGYEEIVKILLENGANPDMPGFENSIPLHMAVSKNYLKIAEMLLEHGSNTEARNIYNISPKSLSKSSEMDKILNTISRTSILHSLSQNIIIPSTCLSKAVIYCQDLQKEKIEKLAKIISSSDLNLSRSFKMDETVTHVIVNTKDDLLCDISTSVLIALLRGRWIISDKWIEKGDDIEDFEVKGVKQFPNANAAKRARISVLNQLPKLFSGCHFYFWGPTVDANISKITISRFLLNLLVEYGGGTLLKREPNPELIADREKTSPYHVDSESCLKICSHYIIYNPHAKEPLIKYNMPHIKSLPLQWMIDCIINYRLIEPN